MAPKQSCAFVTFVKREVAEQAAKNTHKIPGWKNMGHNSTCTWRFYIIRFNRKKSTYHTYHLGFPWMIFAKDTALGNRCLGKMLDLLFPTSESKDPEDQWQQGARHLGPPAGRVDVATGWNDAWDRGLIGVTIPKSPYLSLVFCYLSISIQISYT